MLVTWIAVIHFEFLNPSLVAVRRRSGNPNGSVIGLRAYLRRKDRLHHAARSAYRGFH